MRVIRMLGAAIVGVAMAGTMQMARAQLLPPCSIDDVGPTAEACAGYRIGNTSGPLGTAFIDNTLDAWELDSFMSTAGFDALNSDDSSSDGFTADSDSVSFGEVVYGDMVVGLRFGAGQGQLGGFAIYHLDAGAQGLSGFSFTNPGLGNLSYASLWASDSVPAVPEPQTYALMLAGLVAVLSLSRRRRLA